MEVTGDMEELMSSLRSPLVGVLLGLVVFPSSLEAAPDRDLGLHLRGGDKGMGASVFITDHLGLELGFSSNMISDRSFELDGFTPFAEGSYGIRFGAVLGVFWEQTALLGIWHPKDELSWRVAARWRPQKLYQVEARSLSVLDMLMELELAQGSVRSIPLTVGVAYTFWVLPWGSEESWWSKLMDFGVVLRVEAGPDFAAYDLEKLPFMAAGARVEAGEETRVQESRVEAYWNFQLGVVF